MTGKQKLATDIEQAIKAVIAPLVAAKAPQPEEVETPAVVAEANAAEGEEAAEKPKAAPKPKGPALGVLFTAFIIQ